MKKGKFSSKLPQVNSQNSSPNVSRISYLTVDPNSNFLFQRSEFLNHPTKIFQTQYFPNKQKFEMMKSQSSKNILKLNKFRSSSLSVQSQILEKLAALDVESIKQPELQHIRLCLKSLEHLANCDAMYENILIKIKILLQKALFVDKTQLTDELILMLERTNQVLLDQDNEIPYQIVVQKVQKYINHESIKAQKTKEDCQRQVEELKKENEDLKDKIQVVTVELDEIKSQPQPDLYEMEKNQLKLKAQHKEIKQLNLLISQYTQRIKEMDQEQVRDQKQIIGLKDTIKQLEVKIKQLNQTIQNQQNDAAQKKSVTNQIAQQYEKAILKLQTQANLQRQQLTEIRSLQDEIDRLSLRAAVNFEELTPRPNMQNVYDEFSILTGEN